MDISQNNTNYIYKKVDIWCVLGDCMRLYCHHCYPVVNCSKNHPFCSQYGCCKEIISVNYKNPQET